VARAHIDHGFPRLSCPDSSIAAAIDDAALQAVRQWRFLPSANRVRGKQYTIVVRFPPGPADSWAYGKLRGRLVDDSTGSPLPYAAVYVLGTRRGPWNRSIWRGAWVSVDQQGAFETTAPPGRWRVSAIAVGYGRVILEAGVETGRADTMVFRLKRMPVAAVWDSSLWWPR
jgi:hypothetical protein